MALYGGSEAEWPHGRMVSLARKPPEPRPLEASPQMRPVEYPYGCCLSFDDETMAALGLNGEMPSPGDVLEFFATAVITSASKDPVTGHCRVELQITEMLPHEEEAAYEDAMEESAARRERWYPGDGEKAFAPFDGNREVEPHP